MHIKKDIHELSKTILCQIWKTLKANNSYKEFLLYKIGRIGNDAIVNGMIGGVLRRQYECTSVVRYSYGFWKIELDRLIRTGLHIVMKKDSTPLMSPLSDIFSMFTCLMLLVSCNIDHFIRIFSQEESR